MKKTLILSCLVDIYSAGVNIKFNKRGHNLIGMEKRWVVLLTDFGQKDIYAGVLKGVVASISPETNVIVPIWRFH